MTGNEKSSTSASRNIWKATESRGISITGGSVMDKHTGKVLVPAMYGSVDMASEKIIKCSLERYGNNNYVLFDLKGRKIE